MGDQVLVLFRLESCFCCCCRFLFFWQAFSSKAIKDSVTCHVLCLTCSGINRLANSVHSPVLAARMWKNNRRSADFLTYQAGASVSHKLEGRRPCERRGRHSYSARFRGNGCHKQGHHFFYPYSLGTVWCSPLGSLPRENISMLYINIWEEGIYMLCIFALCIPQHKREFYDAFPLMCLF